MFKHDQHLAKEYTNRLYYITPNHTPYLYLYYSTVATYKEEMLPSVYIYVCNMHGTCSAINSECIHPFTASTET